MTVGSQRADGAVRDFDTVFRRDCPTREILDHLTGRWGLLVLAALRPGPRRFYELRDRIDGISEKMLSQTLRTLDRDGLVERTVEPTKPPRVTYELTELGAAGAAHLCALIAWIGDSAPEIVAAQLRFDGSR
ncbi:winged helix-turn-helix transcriptional regulator [Nocardia wallacei]|uniref:winged helix-turn-helix transcriptional regulator n=1 Tax=Nocardia wallacei TaxID=480035 RepID=UPI0024552F6D|nr:helix-turn-helix domain-containing protein [Nocardia wallacei]